MKKPFLALPALLLAAAVATAAWAQAPQLGLARTQLTIGMHRIEVQLAQTNDERMTGLMFREEMPQQEGMLFVFEQPSQQCFWMKNTILPLSAAFIGDDGTIVNIEDMAPQTLESHCSRKPVRYVLEMNKGWFAKRGVKPGMKFAGDVFSR
ncbi:MAG TPA: DUF192 domain-containing protein [Ramlibacter sp.]|uniref:DUF192 domain-containing protein n=1 Tax=Ramlibacter sp. TaxID=1917967 RepID=UPI002CB28F13|nr:DUF192 domain-containing protein [Ramlibacter sp.]HVZ46749.1 DUF192 domain-containing protein [Ramlibacter sp.]